MNRNYYTDLPPFNNFADLTKISNYHTLPDDWLIAVSDIVSSSEAIEKGMYQAVNAISAAAITAVLNATKPIDIPYVFGGDGASFCVPAALRGQVEAALLATRNLARDSFQLDLRVGLVPIETIHSAGYRILVGKYQPSPHFHQAVFQGGGLKYAENLLKENGAYHIDENKVAPDASFEGFECRWNEIPSAEEETVALMVQSRAENEADANKVYADVLQAIFRIYGEEMRHHPLREKNLSLTLAPMKLAPEAMIRSATQGMGKMMSHLMRAWLATALGKFLMKFGLKNSHGDWGRYKAQLIENTDYRKFDETLRMVLSGSETQRKELDTYLQAEHQRGHLVYGIHASSSALLTCLVFNYDTEHVHFLDASNGGYALAAQAMKKQLPQDPKKLIS